MEHHFQQKRKKNISIDPDNSKPDLSPTCPYSQQSARSECCLAEWSRPKRTRHRVDIQTWQMDGSICPDTSK